MATRTNIKKKTTAKIQGMMVPIKWNTPDNIITRFASNMVVQLLENEFKISFFEINPDIIFGIENKPPDEVQANCVASVIITANKLPVFIEVLQNQYNAYNELKSKLMLPVITKEP